MTTFPNWLAGNRKNEKRINSFLHDNHAIIEDYRKEEVTFSHFFPKNPVQEGRFSEFIAPRDSFFYSNLLIEALTRYPKAQSLIDLGTGSAIPLISALVRTNASTQTLAIDRDREVLATAKSNLSLFGLSSQVTLREQTFEDFFKQSDSGQFIDAILGCNPR